MIKQVDYCILGAGLAGISLAYELSKEGVSVCLIDPNGIASGASGTPLGLVNPATGRYATLSWKAKECYSSILKNLSFIQSHSTTPFFKKTGILRPALDEKIASKMRENFQSTSWPDGWIKWFDERELKKFHPGINCVGGGVWIPIGITVDIPGFLNSFVHFLKTKSVISFFDSEYSLSRKKKYWEINFSDKEKINAKNIIFTTGWSAKENSFWSDLPIHPVKGQLAILESKSSLPFTHTVSALGYIASLDSKKFVVGSTYEHSFKDTHTNKEGLSYLLHRFERVMPDLAKNSSVISQWSGIRASTPNRMPIIGSHPTEDNLFLFAGLGSKGLLYSCYLAKRCREYLISNTPLPADVDLRRFK